MTPRTRTAPSTSLPLRVYTRIRDAILEGQLPPGSPLSRRRLAEQLSVSTIPVSEALKRLESEGFVESRPRAGTRVRIPTADDIRGNYILREALETHSARLFAETATAAQKAGLLESARRLDQGHEALFRAAKLDPRRHAHLEKAHVVFHIRIAQGTRCRQLIEAIERSRVLLLNWLFGSAGRLEPLPGRWHQDVAEALACGSPAEAAEAMRVHVRFRMDETIERFRQFLPVGKTPGRITRGPQRQTLEKNAAPQKLTTDEVAAAT